LGEIRQPAPARNASSTIEQVQLVDALCWARAYAGAYGLTHDGRRCILDPADVKGPSYPSGTFRVLKKNEIARFGAYRTARLVLAAWDRMARGELAA